MVCADICLVVWDGFSPYLCGSFGSGWGTRTFFWFLLFRNVGGNFIDGPYGIWGWGHGGLRGGYFQSASLSHVSHAGESRVR